MESVDRTSHPPLPFLQYLQQLSQLQPPERPARSTDLVMVSGLAECAEWLRQAAAPPRQSRSHKGVTLLKLVSYFQALWADREDKGATAVEYGLIVAAIAAVIVVTVFTIGGRVETAFQTVCNNLAGAGTC